MDDVTVLWICLVIAAVCVTAVAAYAVAWADARKMMSATHVFLNPEADHRSWQRIEFSKPTNSFFRA